MAKKIYRKKLTNSGGGVCFMTGLAAVLALCTAAGDFIAGAVYSQFYKNQVYDMDPDPKMFLQQNILFIITAVFAMLMFVKALNSGKAKYMSKEFGWSGIVMGLAFAVSPALTILDNAYTESLDLLLHSEYDSEKFRSAVFIGRNVAIPLLICLLLIISGMIVLDRLVGEYFTVEVPCAEKKSKKAKTDDEESAHGFGGGTRNVQGLTGETKPATYSEHTDDTNDTAPVNDTAVNITEDADKPKKKPTVRLCPNCGELVAEDELFCSACGQKM